MTRGGEIIIQSYDYGKFLLDTGFSTEETALKCMRVAFIDGARWADAHPNKDNMATAYKVGEAATIDKACEWFDCYIDNYLFIDAENKAGVRWDDFINDFRKAMKGD